MKNSSFLARAAIFAGSGMCVLIFGFIDYATGYELGFFVFYFLPIAITAWLLGAIPSVVISALSSATWLVADLHAAHHYSNISYAIWNTFIRLIAFLTIAYAMSKIQTLLVEERKISQDLRDALSRVKTLKGLIPICARCKKILNDKGYWQQVEDYVANYTEAQFSHGLCRQCAEKILKEAGLDETGDEKPAQEDGFS